MRFRFLIPSLILITIFSCFSLIPLANSVPERKTILWYQRLLNPDQTIQQVGEWASALSFNSIAIYGDMSASEIDTLQALGLKVFDIWIPDMWTLYNWTDFFTTWRDYLQSKGYDGAIADDTQNVWNIAHNQSIDDLTYYQQFMDNTTYVSSVLGQENTIVEMAIQSDAGDYGEMAQVNSTVTFSYYYEPSPVIRYQGYYTNTTADAWNITDWYSDYALNSYYAYEGWLWLEGFWSSYQVSTLDLMKTYNAVVDLAGNYTVYDLFIYNFYQNYGNPRTQPFLKEINDAWIANKKLNEERITLQDFDAKYWQESFDRGFVNQTSLTYLGWLINEAQKNYSWTITDTDKLSVNFDGTNALGTSGVSFSRAISVSEMGQTIQYKLTPDSYLSWKQIVIQGAYPYPNAYLINFGYGQSKPLIFGYRNATNDDVTVALGSWKQNSTYIVTHTFNETSVFSKMQNSTWSWNTTISGNPLSWNSMKLNAILIQDYTGNWPTETEFHSMDIEYVNLNPISSRDYVTMTEWKAEEFIEGTAEHDFEAVYGGTIPPKHNVSLLAIGSYGFRFNITVGTGFYLQWFDQPILPLMFIMGMTGLGCMFIGPSWAVLQIKRKKYEDGLVAGLIFTSIGIALFVAWLTAGAL